MGDPTARKSAIIGLAGLESLLVGLRGQGYRVLGPTVHDGAIGYDDIETVADLPSGWTDVQEAGRYRLERRNDDALFGYVVGPQSWKKFLHPPAETVWRARRSAGSIQIEEPATANERFAFVGVRSCEIAAIGIQDRVFLGSGYADKGYGIRRQDAFIVAVNCGQAGGTCFCVSMGTGPKATTGYDLALTEIIEPGRHVFVVEVGSDRGEEVLATIPHAQATTGDLTAAEAIAIDTAAHMGREMETTGLRELLQGNLTHSEWEKVADRCLTCGNCTMVCPTCFCTTVEDHTDLTGLEAERVRVWDSCFTMDFSYLHGGSVRKTGTARYRQWMTHKLSSWIDQFGTSGCVGCGRCITWCPVGIDITEEVALIRATTSPEDAGARA
jgi:ferredoxin